MTDAAIPTLETERLVLRGPEPRDAEPWIAFLRSERAAHVGGPMERDRAWRAYCVQLGHWPMRGFGNWAVVEKETLTCVGLVGCWFPEGWPEHELAWTVFETAEGRGYAHEAAVAARACAYVHFGWRTAVSYVAPANARSRALAERLGCVVDHEAPSPFTGGEIVYRHPSPEALR